MLQIVRYDPPWGWTWELSDGNSRLLSEAKLDPRKPGHQMLLERDALARRIPGPELRSDMTSHLRALLTEELATALEMSEAGTLIVAGPRATQVAMTLPFELLFGRDDAGAAVVRTVVSAQASGVAEVHGERIVTAFPLTPDQHYLPLHLEAELLAEHARGAGVALDELFVCFTAEDLLRASRGASMVHLAGHGSEGMLRCEWRDRPAAVLTAADLVDAWREDAPRLVVLGFCESSSERDELRWAHIVARGDLSLRDLARIAPAAAIPSASMAFDLVAALPTTVIGLRTNADDTEARRFLDAFYGAHLGDGMPVERAYAGALDECGFLDGVGLPVPILYASAAGAPLDQRAITGSADAPVRCLPPSDRRSLNVLYEATAALGSVIDRAWGCRVSGVNPGLRMALIEGFQAATEIWHQVQGVVGPRPAFVLATVDEAHCEIMSRSVLPDGARIVRVDLDRWPRPVTIGELLAARTDTPLDRIELLARGTCDVPALVDTVIACGVDITARNLRERAGGSDTTTDWTLARELLDLLPERAATPIRDWSERRWRVVESLGQPAIDIAAAFAVLPEGEYLFDSDQPILAHIYRRTPFSPIQLQTALTGLAKGRALGFGTGILEGEWAHMLSCDLLTAQRGWSRRSAGTAAALAEYQIERELTRLPSIEFIETLDTSRLAWLVERCLECGHPRLPSLLAQLELREGGNEIARSLTGQHNYAPATTGPDVVKKANEDTRWGAWDRLVEEARFADAAVLLDAIEATGAATDHPLRIETNRLITRTADADQGALLRDAQELERCLVAAAQREDHAATQIELLLIARQAISSALEHLGRLDEAADILLDHFKQTLRLGARPSACIHSGVYAIRMLCLNHEADRARPVCDVLLALVDDLAPSSPTVLVHTAEVEVLVSEGREVHAIAAAEDLLRQLEKWQDPIREQVRAALVPCAAAVRSTPRGVALFAAIHLTWHDDDMFAGENLRTLAKAWRRIEAGEVIAAADELSETIPTTLRALNLSPAAFRDGACAFIKGCQGLVPDTPTGRLFGELGAEALLSRAASGCPLSEHILDTAGFTVAGEPKESEAAEENASTKAGSGASWRAYDAAGIAREHPRLKEAFDDQMPETLRAVLPVLRAALHGDREARLVWAATVVDVSIPVPSLVPQALLALMRGDMPTTWKALCRQTNLGATISICIAIEECCLWQHESTGEPESISAELSSLALAGWEGFLRQAAYTPPAGAAVYLALASVFGSTHVLLAALLEARCRGVSLAHLTDADERGPVSRRVSDLLEENKTTQLVLAGITVEREPDNSDEALKLLAILAGDACVELARSARVARLGAVLALERRELIDDALEQVLERIDEIDSDSPDCLAPLNLVALAMLELDRPDEAARVASDLLAHPDVKASSKSRHGCFALAFRALVAAERIDEAAKTLADAGTDLGLEAACTIVLGAAGSLEPDPAKRFAAVMLSLAMAEKPGGDSWLRSAPVVRFLETIGDSDIWAPVRLVIEASLEET